MRIFAISRWQKKLAASALTITMISLPNAASAQLLRGGGDSFAETLYQRYSKEYEQQTGEKFQYKVLGNLGGIRLFINKSVDFGGTSLIPTPIEKNQMEDGLLMVPTGGGAIAIVYNLEDVTTDVKISREKLAQIFTGKITNWQQIDPRFPNRDLRVIVSSESSANSFILTKYLQKITNREVVASRKPDWGFSVYASFPKDGGIAGEVRRIDGAIGYVSQEIAIANNLPIARIENQDGRYVKPTLDETKKALANVKFKDDFTTEDIDDPPDGYPLVSLAWLMVYQKYAKQDILEANKRLMTWILTNGQSLNEDLGYTKIPEDITQKILESINQKLIFRPY